MTGGQGPDSGLIYADGNLQSVTIGGDLTGASVTGTTSVNISGAIEAVDHIGSVLIKGSIIAGSNGGTGTLVNSGAIFSDTADIGSITVMHNIVGNATASVDIAAVGPLVKPASGYDLAIGSLTVDGSVSYVNVQAGFSGDGATPANANASIGSIIVKGNWSASNAVAGAVQNSAPDWGLGDTLQSGGAINQPATIESIVIGGYLTGAVTSSQDFGFVAQTFNSISIGGHLISLTPGAIPQAQAGNVYLEVV